MCVLTLWILALRWLGSQRSKSYCWCFYLANRCWATPTTQKCLGSVGRGRKKSRLSGPLLPISCLETGCKALVEAIVAFVNTHGKGSWRFFLEWDDLCSLLSQSRFDVLAFIMLASCVIMTLAHRHVTYRSGKKSFRKESKHGGYLGVLTQK